MAGRDISSQCRSRQYRWPFNRNNAIITADCYWFVDVARICLFVRTALASHHWQRDMIYPNIPLLVRILLEASEATDTHRTLINVIRFIE